MKISTNKVKVIPAKISSDFAFSIYGSVDPEVSSWIEHHGFKTNKTGKNGEFTNIEIPVDINIEDLFKPAKAYDWMDAFSPNLNKKLHIGHFSNLVLAKAYKAIGATKKLVSLYGDTQEGEVSKKDAMGLLRGYQYIFDFHPDLEVMASEVVYHGRLKPGEDNYEGTMAFEVGDQKVVGIKSDGQTSYFYHDAALAQKLGAPTLYLTGKEQNNHFELLKVLYPHIHHIGLGLVKVSGKKMGTREGNVVLIEDLLKESLEDFDNNVQLVYNVFAGFILKSAPEVDKNVNLDVMNNPKNSAGLYISYTTARLCSAGCEMAAGKTFSSPFLAFAYIRSKEALKPSLFFEELVFHCQKISGLYEKHKIQGNPENKKVFDGLLADLLLGCEKLGLFVIEKV